MFICLSNHCVYTYTYMCICICDYTCINVYMHICMSDYVCKYIYICMCVYLTLVYLLIYPRLLTIDSDFGLQDSLELLLAGPKHGAWHLQRKGQFPVGGLLEIWRHVAKVRCNKMTLLHYVFRIGYSELNLHFQL